MISSLCRPQMYAPFIDDGDDLLSQVCQLQIFFSLLSAIVLKTNPNSEAMGYILPAMIMVPPIAAVVFEMGLIEAIAKAAESADNGIPTPFGRVGVGIRARAVIVLERLLGVKHVTGEEEEESAPAVALTEAEEREHGMVVHIRNTFRAFDADESGGLDCREMRNALKFYGVDISQPRVDEIIHKYDDQPDGRIEMVEFAALVSDIEIGMLRTEAGNRDSVEEDMAITIGSVPAHIKAAFKAFDADKSGGLNYKELRSALKFYGIDVSQPRAAQLIKNYDDDPDGKMQLEEFAELVDNVEKGMLRLGPKPKNFREPNASETSALVTLQSHVRGKVAKRVAAQVRMSGTTAISEMPESSRKFSLASLFSPKAQRPTSKFKDLLQALHEEKGDDGVKALMSELGYVPVSSTGSQSERSPLDKTKRLLILEA